jgi:hypothetical protein
MRVLVFLIDLPVTSIVYSKVDGLAALVTDRPDMPAHYRKLASLKLNFGARLSLAYNTVLL